MVTVKCCKVEKMLSAAAEDGWTNSRDKLLEQSRKFLAYFASILLAELLFSHFAQILHFVKA